MRTEGLSPLSVCVLLAPALLVLAGTLSVGFVSDDFYLIHRIVNEGFFSGWGGPGGDMYFRPVTVLSYCADYAVYGLRPLGWHLTNLLWHMTCSLLVFLLARALRGSDWEAFCAGYLFLLLACHSESAAWVSGRSDLIATAFCLASLPVFLKGSPWALILFAAGLLAKESVLVTPALWAVAGMHSPNRNARSRLLISLGALLAVVYAAARILTSTNVSDGVGNVSLPEVPENLVRYSFRVFVPPLSEAARPFLARYPFAVPLFLAAAVVTAAFITIRRALPVRKLAVPTLAFFVSLAPVIFLKVSLVDTRSERFLYLPGAFAVTALAEWVFQVFGKRTATILLIALALVQGAFLHGSVTNWRRAGEICSELIREPVSNPPDTYRGAYVFRNGYREALTLFGE